jgi:hypothetical protein
MVKATYHRCLTRGPWLSALRQLHRRGWSDRDIADCLSELSPEDIASLDREGWDAKRIESRRRVEGGGSEWTRRQVRYYRRALGLSARHYRHECGTLADARACRHRQHQRLRGWSHLLPAYNDAVKQWEGGHELRPREADVLALLRDHGPLTTYQMATHLLATPCRHRCLLSRGVSLPRRLARRGLVRVVGVKRVGLRKYSVYALAEGVLPPEGLKAATGHERARPGGTPQQRDQNKKLSTPATAVPTCPD